MKNRNMFLKYGSTALALAAVSTASQAAIDVSAVVIELTGVLAPVGAIGAAVLLIIVAIKAFKYVRGAM
jgi:hypothetical protein